MQKIEKIIWDAWNTSHIAKHGVSMQEVEKALSDLYVVYLPTYNGRILALGRSEMRLLAIILVEESEREFYIITAQDMSKKERKVYRNAKKKDIA